MTTVLETNDKLAFVQQLLGYARESLLRMDDTAGYYNLAQCLNELAVARLYVADSEAQPEAILSAGRKLDIANIYLRDAVDCLLGKPHLVYKGGESVEEPSSREWAMQQVALARVAVLESDNVLAINLVSGAPLSTYAQLLQEQCSPVEYHSAPDYELSHVE